MLAKRLRSKGQELAEAIPLPQRVQLVEIARELDKLIDEVERLEQEAEILRILKPIADQYVEPDEKLVKLFQFVAAFHIWSRVEGFTFPDHCVELHGNLLEDDDLAGEIRREARDLLVAMQEHWEDQYPGVDLESVKDEL